MLGLGPQANPVSTAMHTIIIKITASNSIDTFVIIGVFAIFLVALRPRSSIVVGRRGVRAVATAVAATNQYAFVITFTIAANLHLQPLEFLPN